jgi:hypothetical protein
MRYELKSWGRDEFKFARAASFIPAASQIVRGAGAFARN